MGLLILGLHRVKDWDWVQGDKTLDLIRPSPIWSDFGEYICDFGFNKSYSRKMSMN